jgi:hypothetical protein
VRTGVEMPGKLDYFLGRRIEENISVSSWASFSNCRQSSRPSGSAVAIIRSQCSVSFDSFLQIEILCWKSFLDSAPSASM